MHRATLGLLALATTLSCRQPELTEETVLRDLGKDELVLQFWTDPEGWAVTKPCEAKPNLVSVDEGRDAATAAGWIERVCPDDPDRMRLTEEGRRRSARWQKYESTDTRNTRIAWTVPVGRYARSGAPVIARGPTPNDEDTRLPQRFVTIPGRYVPNEDGQRLYDTGWQRIRAVDRIEKFTLWKGIWARRHGGD